MEGSIPAVGTTWPGCEILTPESKVTTRFLSVEKYGESSAGICAARELCSRPAAA